MITEPKLHNHELYFYGILKADRESPTLEVAKKRLIEFIATRRIPLRCNKVGTNELILMPDIFIQAHKLLLQENSGYINEFRLLRNYNIEHNNSNADIYKLDAEIYGLEPDQLTFMLSCKNDLHQSNI